MAKEVIAGVAGGLVGAGLARLTAPPQTRINSSKQVIGRQAIPAGIAVTLRPQITYKFSILLFHGDGDRDVTIQLIKGTETVTFTGDKQAIEVLANEPITIEAVNTNPASPRASPTIEIVALSW